MIIYGLGSVMSIMYVTEVLFNKKIVFCSGLNLYMKGSFNYWRTVQCSAV
jgi:hypothetical protein